MQNKFAKISLLFLRLSLGWLMFYSGINQLTNASWSAAGYLTNAITFPQLFHWLASASILPTINFLNEWGLVVLGASLIFGLCVRLTSAFGMLLMLLYYLPVLSFPFIQPGSYLVDEHIIYIFVLLVFISTSAGRVYGLDGVWIKLGFAKKHPKIVKLLA
jgi:thiosulfate dehydrogenase [quinone] large subunit